MRLKSLQINAFRNLKKVELSFDPDQSVFSLVGPNGQGKTNVLEAIFLLAISKSFRTRENEDLINFEWDYCAIKGVVEKGEDATELDMVVTRQPLKKTLKVNGVQKKAVDYIGNLNVVFFSPDDIGMIHLAPGVRRRYLDLLLSQLDHEYLEDSLKYQHALKQRNSLLKQIINSGADESELDFWDDQLADFGLKIMNKRKMVVDELNDYASGFYKDVSDNDDDLKIEYFPKLQLEDPESIKKTLGKNRSRDIAIGSTQLGPHRDDLIFLCNGHDMSSFASRGEWRSLVLTLKFAEIDLLKKKKGFYPILLLDDVFSELDENRQKYLFNMIKNTQTFITTTHSEFLDVIEGSNQIYKVKNGEIGI
ncbi:DNA replication/repair protein RecF [candidate division KSB1 bacterium]